MQIVSTIFHVYTGTICPLRLKRRPVTATATATRERTDNPLLAALGERVRAQREKRGVTRKTLAAATGVSERHLANLEYGDGNPSVLVLQQVADALHCPLAELTGDFTTRSPEWLLLRSLLRDRDESHAAPCSPRDRRITR